MKKLMFSALACITFAFSGFASNEVVNEEINSVTNEIALDKVEYAEDFGTCLYALIRQYTNGKGNYYTVTKTFATSTSTEKACDDHIAAHVAAINTGVMEF